MHRLDSLYGQTLCGAVSLGGEVHPEVVRRMLERVLPVGRSVRLQSDAPPSTLHSPHPLWSIAATCEPVDLDTGKTWFDGDCELNQSLHAPPSTPHSPPSTVHRPLSTLHSLPGGWCLVSVTTDGAVHLACDRVGLRDLYYTAFRDVLYFSTIIRSFYQIPGWTTGTDASRVSEYMAYRRIAGRHTLYANVDRVLPGECISVPPGARSPAHTRYWTYHCSMDGAGQAQAPEAALHTLLQAQLGGIRQTPALDPFLMLSGGVDSAGLLAEACHMGWQLPALTLLPDDPRFSEHDAVKAIHACLGTRGELVDVDAGLLLANIDLTHAVLEQPVVHTIALLHMELYRTAAEQGRNAFICGEAADTLFGYDRFARYQQIWQGSWSPLNCLMRLMAGMTGNSKAALWTALNSDAWMGHVCRSRAYVDDVLLQGVVRDWVPPHRERLRILTNGLDAVGAGARNQCDALLEACSRYYFETFIQDCRIFVALGRATGLEPILPYAASAVRDFALALPAALKFHGGKGKYLLKKAMEAHLPTQVVWGHKRSGEQPLGRWMRTHAGLQAAVERVCWGDTPVADYLNMDRLGRCCEEHMRGERDWSVLLWQVLGLDAWMRRLGRGA